MEGRRKEGRGRPPLRPAGMLPIVGGPSPREIAGGGCGARCDGWDEIKRLLGRFAPG